LLASTKPEAAIFVARMPGSLLIVTTMHVRIQNLTKRFGDTLALKHISLEIRDSVAGIVFSARTFRMRQDFVAAAACGLLPA
jgi:hypothetical protein